MFTFNLNLYEVGGDKKQRRKVCREKWEYVGTQT